MGRKKYALVDLTVFTNGCKVLLHTEQGLMSAENKVPREADAIIARLIGKTTLVLLKSFPDDPVGQELEIKLIDLGFEIQKL